jgi:hypothetical protein
MIYDRGAQEIEIEVRRHVPAVCAGFGLTVLSCATAAMCWRSLYLAFLR